MGRGRRSSRRSAHLSLTLQQSLRRWNWITSLVTLAGIAAVGVLVLWVPNTAWGTVQDVILAILGGAGTRLAIGTIATPGGARVSASLSVGHRRRRLRSGHDGRAVDEVVVRHGVGAPCLPDRGYMLR